LRNNVNADVNKLFQEGKVIKICGDKIYRFYSQQHFSKITGKHLQPQTTCNYLQELLEDMQGSDDQDDPFTQLIGFDGSLRNAILSAKAGILYPGGALHTLL
jgi:transcriptional regulator with AAA-type ATPase domain